MKQAGRATIFELRDMIGGPHVGAQLPDGRYVQAVPLPFSDGLLARCRAAWEVICGRAYPVAWPAHGDLEKALQPNPPGKDLERFQQRPTSGANWAA